MGTKLIERGITRYDIDEQGTYGYMVRISRMGEHTNIFFSDKTWKGKRKALAAAREKYQYLADSLPPPTTTKGIKTRRNQTGMVGVHLAVCNSYYGDQYSSYCASWKSEDGSRRKISFSFKKYGKKSSWEMACIARELESTDRARVEKLHAKRKKAKKGLAPPPKATVLAGTKKTKKSATKKKAVKKSSAKKKVVKKAKKKVVTKKATKKKTKAKKKVAKKSKAKSKKKSRR